MIFKRLKNLFQIIIIVCATLWGYNLNAQVIKLNLDDALKMAVENNHDIKASRLNVQKSEAMVDEALGNALPSVNISANYTRNLKVPVFFVPGAFFNQPNVPFVATSFSADNQYQAVASFNQILFNSAVLRE